MAKTLILFGAGVGGCLGFLPSAWGDNDLMSPVGILLSIVGTIAGIWAGYKVAQNLDV